MKWSRQMLDRMEVLASHLCSGAMIADTLNSEFGSSLSRSAVLGKAWREGIELCGASGPEIELKVIDILHDTVIAGVKLEPGRYVCRRIVQK